MLSGVTAKAFEITGTAVFRIVVSSDSIKNATATSHGNRRRAASDGVDEGGGAINGPGGFIRRNFGEDSPPSC